MPASAAQSKADMLYDAKVAGPVAVALRKWGTGKLPLALSVFATPLTLVRELAANTIHESFVRMQGSDDSKDTAGGLLVQPNCMRSAMKAADSLLLLVSQTAFYMQTCALTGRGHGRDQAMSFVLNHASNTRVVINRCYCTIY